MLTVSSLIEFLLNLLRDDHAQAEFAADPQGMLARHGLGHLSAQDVCDVTPMVADHPGVHAKHSAAHSGSYHGDDPVQAISHITRQYDITHVSIDESREYTLTYVDDRDTLVQIDDRDTTLNVDDRDSTSIHAEGDLTIEDSFNQDNDTTLIEDSYNQDNDGLDNKEGTIDDSAAAGEDIEDSFTDDDTTTTDSYKTDNHTTDLDTTHDDTTITTINDTYTTDNHTTDLDTTHDDHNSDETQIAS